MQLSLTKFFKDNDHYYNTGNYNPYNPCFIEPLLLDNSSSNESLITDDVLYDLFEAIKLNQEDALSSLYRVYVDGNLSPEYERKFVNANLDRTNSLKEHLEGIASGKKFGLIINGIEKWSLPLADFAIKKLNGISETIDPESTFFEITMFAGNYGYTPFGIHMDDPYTTVVHFHLGPSSKQMTLLTPDTFHKYNGPNKTSFSPDDLVNYGMTYNIYPGNVFILPPHYYHVGYTSEFSIGIAVAVTKYPKEKVYKQALDNYLSFHDLSNLDKDVSSLNVDVLIEKSHKLYQEGLKSKCNLRYAYDGKLDQSCSLDYMLNNSCIVLSEVMDNTFFIRGNRFEIKSLCRSRFSKLVKVLSEDYKSKNEIIKIFNNYLPEVDADMIFSVFLQYGGFFQRV